jgi:hypothetical protein
MGFRDSLIKLVYPVNCPLDAAALDAASLPSLPNLEEKILCR